MQEMANTTKELTQIDSLAAQARVYAQGAAMNLLQLGRVLTEAKPLVAHGEWSEWVRANALMSVRTAQLYMQAYSEFGLNPKIAELGTTKVIRLLPMSEEEREELLRDNDVAGMSTRDLDECLREMRRDARKEAMEEARAAIEAAEERAREAESRERDIEIPKELLDELQTLREDLKEAQDSAGHFGELARQAVNDRAAAERRASDLQRDLDEQADMMREQQDALNAAQEELLNLQSREARGGAEDEPAGELTADVFAAAVRAFVGQCARMPYMGGTFASMPTARRREYDELLRTVEGWCETSRRALESVAVEGGIVCG